MNYELFQNVALSVFSILASFGMIILYYKIWKISLKIKCINKQIEEQNKILNKQELKSIKSDNDVSMAWLDNGVEKQMKRRIEHGIELLERQKKYYLEEISIYSIFKK